MSHENPSGSGTAERGGPRSDPKALAAVPKELRDPLHCHPRRPRARRTARDTAPDITPDSTPDSTPNSTPDSAPDITIQGPSPFAGPADHDEAIRLVRRLVRRLLPRSVSEAGPLCLVPLAGGRSRALVFRLNLPDKENGQGAERRAGMALAIKITSRTEGLREKALYERHVRPGLPADHHAALLGFARHGQRAALAYAYVGDPRAARPETLTDRLRQGDTDAIDRVLGHLFMPRSRGWHAPEARRMQPNLARYYRERFFPGDGAIAGSEKALAREARHQLGARRRKGGYMIGGTIFPPPSVLLDPAMPKRAYCSAIQHGDLNSDNLVLEGQQGLRLIDFQKTGRAPVHLDLAFLECSLRINLPPGPSDAVIMESEGRIARGDPFTEDPGATAILRIRSLARRSFPGEENETAYAFAIAVLGLRLMQATDLSPTARARIAAASLWAARTVMDA